MNLNVCGICQVGFLCRVVLSLSALLPLAVVVGCGGGASTDNEQDARVSVPAPQHVVAQLDVRDLSATERLVMRACIDLDGDLQCGANEPVASLGIDNVFSFEISPDVRIEAANIVVPVHESAASGSALEERVTTNTTPAYVLAAKVRPTTVVNVLTTLQVMQGRRDTSVNDLETFWKLAKSVAIHDTADQEASRLNEIARVAFLEALSLATVDAGAGPIAVLSTSAAAAALADVLAAYIDAGTGTLLRTATSRVLATQVAQRLRPSRCETAAVASITIETTDQVPIVSKDNYVRATIQVDGADGLEPQVLTTRIRGRGNSTWGMPKKPYRLSLDQATSLLGMPADRDWALLANYADKSLMRNAVAFCLGRMLALDYTPRHRYAELTLNGEYHGVYQLVEHIKVADERVAIGSASTLDEDPGMGFLLEIDGRLDADVRFVSPAGVPFAVKSGLTSGQLANIVAYVGSTESALFGNEFRDPDQGYLRYLDADTLVDFYLVNELLRNNDAFSFSTFLHRVRDGRLRFGPLWDFDIAAGNINYSGNEATEGWWAREASIYMKRLLEDEAFAQHVRVRWAFLSSRMPELQAFIGDVEIALQEPQARNFTRWPILDVWVWPNAVVTGSYDGEVSYLRNWLSARAAWMDEQMNDTSTP